MKLEIWKGEERLGEVTLGDGEHGVGGGDRDSVQLPGERDGHARLWVEGSRLSVESDEHLEVGGLSLPPRMRRLVIAGERIELGRYHLIALAEPLPAGHGTRALAFGLLAGEVDLEPPASLTCLTGLDAGRVFPLSDAAVELGRGEDAGVRLRDRAVSRRHARLGREGELFFLEALDSPNGLFVDGARIRKKAVLEDGALIELGQTLLRFKGPMRPKAPEPQAAAVPAQAAAPEPMVEAEPAAEKVAVPRASGEFWLMGLGLLVFVAGVLVTASCLAPPSMQAGAYRNPATAKAR